MNAGEGGGYMLQGDIWQKKKEAKIKKNMGTAHADFPYFTSKLYRKGRQTFADGQLSEDAENNTRISSLQCDDFQIRKKSKAEIEIEISKNAISLSETIVALLPSS